MASLSDAIDVRGAPDPALGPVNILLVDDEPKNLLALESILAGEDRRLMMAHSGEDALRWLLKERFAVVLLDVHMPGMDGFETATLIRRHVRSYSTPIIFLTAANRDDAHVIRGYSLGAVDYIFKPIDVGILRSKVAVFVDLFRKTEQVRQQAALLAEAGNFLENLLQSTTDYAIIARDLDGKVAGWYEGARKLYGYTAEEMVGLPCDDLLFASAEIESGAAARLLEAALATGTAEGVFQQMCRGGDQFTASVTVNLQKDAGGAVIGYVLIAKDITEQQRQEQQAHLLIREQAARAEAETVNRRFALLAAASDELGRLLHGDEALHAVARLTTHDLAEACVIVLLAADGAIGQIVVAARDPDFQSRLDALLPAGDTPSWLADPATTDEPLLLTAGIPEGDGGRPADEETRQALLALGVTDGLVLPIPGQPGSVGTLWLLRAGQPPFERRDLDFAGDLARRIGLALDNARLYQAAQEAIRIREEFFSIASHELRTPVTSLRGQAQLMARQLERGREVEPQRLIRAFRVIDEQSEKLARLVSQLLDISRLEVGKLVLEPADCDITALVEEIVTQFGVATTRSIELHATGTITGIVDALRLEQVITNLIDNALKYSPAESPVEVDLLQPSSETVQLLVRDWGPGVPPEHRDRIFERFHRAERDRHPSGMGIGLYISRQIVDLHGGTIEAQFPEDGGTRFAVTLPLAPSSA